MAALSSSSLDTINETLPELEREAAIGSMGTESSTREIRTISLYDFDRRREEISDELWAAATNLGFFQVVDHGLDLSEIKEMFETSEKFFALPIHAKLVRSQHDGRNAGFESTQKPPSTGTVDQKESYRFNRPGMRGLWPSNEEIAGFREIMEAFEYKCWKLAMTLLSCFAEKLGFERDFFTRAHEPTAESYQSMLRLLYYYPLPAEPCKDETTWRAGAHTDFGNLTLLFQRAGQGGLQVLPGAEAESKAWTSVVPSNEAITCNIGDMLMRWSDNRLPSNFHRVRMPRSGEDTGPRYSIAFFTQANREVIIQGPKGAYEPISAADFMQQRLRAFYP